MTAMELIPSILSPRRSTPGSGCSTSRLPLLSRIAVPHGSTVRTVTSSDGVAVASTVDAPEPMGRQGGGLVGRRREGVSQGVVFTHFKP